MKEIFGHALAGNPGLQRFALKMATYPRFFEWARQHAGCDTVSGGPREKRNSLFEKVTAEHGLADAPIAYFEFGVNRGESIRWWYETNRNPDSRFYGFDSFEGLPESWMGDRVAGFFSTGGKTPRTADRRVRFLKGWFHETLPTALDLFSTTQQKVIHLDADLYRSTIYVLLLIGPWLQPGDIVIFDEFADSIHEFRAFEDFREIFGFEAKLIHATSGFTQSAFVLTKPLADVSSGPLRSIGGAGVRRAQ